MKHFHSKSNTVILALIFATVTPYCSCERLLKRKVTFSATCSVHTQLDSPMPQTKGHSTTAPPPITIWIHGSRLFPRTVYKSFFNNRPQLKLARDLEAGYSLRQIADTFIARDPQQFSYETFYLLGWSGKLSFTAREETAHELYKQLKKIYVEYKARYHADPFIRIITHSHGGNVALNLVREKLKYDPHSTLHIAQLILLACPVQVKTQKYLHDPMFEKVYALCSALDLIQILDPQGLYPSSKNTPLFSQRCFPNNKKLAQVKIQINNRAITHAEFVTPKFLYYLPNIIQEINIWHVETPVSLEHNQRTRLLCVTTK